MGRQKNKKGVSKKQEMRDKANQGSEDIPNPYEQQLTRLVEDWENRAKETMERAGQKRVKEEPSEQASSIDITEEQVIAEVKRKAEQITGKIMDKMNKRLE